MYRYFWFSIQLACYTDRMELEYSDPRGTVKRRRTLLEITLISGFVFCLFLGLTALMALLFLENAPPMQPETPLDSLQTDHIVAHQALMHLAGDPVDALTRQAINAGELDNAHANVLFATELPTSQRLALSLQLGKRFLAAGRQADAVQAYQLARSIAILDEVLTISERTQALIQTAHDFIELDENGAGLDTAKQVMYIAEQTPDLLPAQRSQIFEALRPIARTLDDESFSQRLNELARNPYLQPSGQLLISRWEELDGTLEPDPAIEAAISTRHEAARQLADRFILTDGADVEPERQTLAAALMAEDQTREEFYQHTLSAGLSLAQQFQLLNEYRSWLATKARIALGGYGIPIVPAWDQNSGIILQNLSTTTANIGTVVDAQIGTLPDPSEQAMLRVELLRWLALQTELGLYPDGSVTDLDERLRFAQGELEGMGKSLALPLILSTDVAPPGFRIEASN